jgi:hypothetical protein
MEGFMPKTIALAPLAVLLTTLGFSQTAPANPGEQLKQYLEELQHNPGDDALRATIISLALTLNPKPPTPDAAWEASGKGAFQLENGKTMPDFISGAAAFGQASLLAPWVPDFYFNQGVLLERAERYPEAIKAFRWYVTANPGGDDRPDVLVRMGRLEAMVEKREQESSGKPEPQQQAAVVPQAERRHVETEAAEPVADSARSLIGDFEVYACSYIDLMKGGATHLDKGCNDTELKGGHWSKLGNYKLIVQRGQILLSDNDSAFVTYIGVPTGPNVSDMRWERFWPPVRIDTLASRRGGADAWGRVNPDSNRVLLSNDRPIDDRDYNPRMRYHYWDLRRREPGH